MFSLMILVIIVIMMASSSQTRDSSATHDRAFDSGIELSSGYSDGDRAMTSSQIPNVTESPPPRDAPVHTTPTSSQNPNFTESPPPRDAPVKTTPMSSQTGNVTESPPPRDAPVQTTPTSSQNPNFTEAPPPPRDAPVQTAPTSSQNANVPESPRPRDAPVQTTRTSSQNPNVPSSTSTTATTSPFKLRIESLILTFEAALALITIRFQAQGNSESTKLLSSFLITMVAATTVFAFTAMLIGLMLERVHEGIATVCSYAGLISIALGFFSMVAVFVPKNFVWFVWAAGGVLGLVFVYSLAKRRYNTSAPTSSSV